MHVRHTVWRAAGVVGENVVEVVWLRCGGVDGGEGDDQVVVREGGEW